MRGSSPNVSPDTEESDVYKKLKSFLTFNTETKRQNYSDEKWEIVEPEEFFLGVRLDTRSDRTTGVDSCNRQVHVSTCFSYNPFSTTVR